MKTVKALMAAGLLVAAASDAAFPQIYIINHTKGVRNIGMGGAGVADLGDPEAGYCNPATLAWTEGVFALSSFHKGYFTDASYMNAAISVGRPGDRFIAGGLAGYTAEYLDYESIEKPNWILYGGAAIGMRKGPFSIGIGALVRKMESKYWGEFSSTSFDVGAVAAWNIGTDEGFAFRPAIGVSLCNLGEDMEGEADEWGEFSMEQYGESRYGVGLNIRTPTISVVSEKLGRKVPGFTFNALYDITRGLGSNKYEGEPTRGWGYGMEASVFETLFFRTGNSRRILYGTDFMNIGFGLGWSHPKNGILFRLDYTRMAPLNTNHYNNLKIDKHMIGLVIGKTF